METESESNGPHWRPLESTERRVLGVLIEKAKTTPDNYPLSLASLTSGCNQKSNRQPQMQLDEDDVYVALDNLRDAGVVVEIQGGGRVSKYRHTAYEWFDVNGPEIAVLTELLLRGQQTAGDLRARASRMSSLKDQAELRPVLESLKVKNLIVELTPPGRGQLFTHNVYPADELEQLKQQTPASASTSQPAIAPRQATSASEIESLRTEVADLAHEVAALKQRLDALES